MMETENEFRKVREIYISYPSFISFLNFCVGDEKFKYKFEYIDSLRTKVSVVGLCLKELLEHISKYQEELDTLRKEGYIEGLQYLTLIVRYETFLNSIYCLMENIAQIACAFHNELPRKFHAQKDKMLEKPFIDIDYSKILEHLEWYDEIRSMRTESTHYLTGTLVNFEGDTPGYINNPKSTRKDTLEKIEIKDIVEHAKSIFKGVELFLEEFGKHYLNLIDGDVRVIERCGITQGLAFASKLISYNEKISGQPGICNSYKLKCPEASTCPARKNIDLETEK